MKPRTVGLKPNNSAKNRYKNIVAYDENRVVLDYLYSNEDDDYINASYINGFRQEKSFIATQAPKPSTFENFWKMILQENVECIVMMTGLIECGKKKSEKYWPDLNEPFECNSVKIECTNIEEKGDITIRTFNICLNQIKRQVTQIHYEGWLDKDVPLTTKGIRSVLELMKPFENDNPIVVHCSAGVGRTGVLILCHIAINMANATENVDMLSILYDLRQQRPKMIQTFEQYQFAFKVVANSIEHIYEYIV